MSDSTTDVKRTWFLEMTSRRQLQPRRRDDTDVIVRRVEQPCPEFNWFLHQAVGAAYRWGGREDWGADEWAEYVSRPGMETWVCYVGGAPAGYFELELLEDRTARIHCFGLLERFMGRGLGGHLLTVAVERAWELRPACVWLTTCSHDHPHALANYQARGFRIVDEETGAANRARDTVLFTC
jgi:ribosomal protein S18 acetylase RimI-like enzyme